NQKNTYMFDIEKCKVCPMKDGCYKEGAKSKTYSVTIKSTEHKEHEAFQSSDSFKEKSKERYKIEAKNSELKHRHGYDVASSSGLVGMQMQGAMPYLLLISSESLHSWKTQSKRIERKGYIPFQCERNIAFLI
ncbi:transposase IS4 family protein, partial [Paenibacillus sp. FSL R5-192]